MNVVKCSNSTEPHFFDGDKYAACPHCGAAPLGLDAKGVKNEKEDKKVGKTDSQSVRMEQIPEHTVGKTFGIFKRNTKNESVETAIKVESPIIPDSPIKSEEANNEAGEKKTEPIHTGFFADANSQSLISQPAIQANVPQQPVMKPVADSGKTQGFFSIKQPSPSVAPIAAGEASLDSAEPCAGWLVCIKGLHFGRNFSIYAGRNSIGRENTNRIALLGDMSVSREKHAWVMYEPKKREFYVQPGEGSGLVYLNDDNVMTTERLSVYDKIEIGEGTYMFIPLCGENFTWEDYMRE